MTMCLCCAALVLNRSMISNQRAESTQSAQAAALAAARELLTDQLLRDDLQPSATAFHQSRARQAAVEISHRYSTQANTPLLSASDVQIGSIVWNHETKQTLFLRNTVKPNRVEVALTNHPGDSSGRLILSNVTGIDRAQIVAHATVALENNIVGFRPMAKVPIPLIPLALPDDTEGRLSGCWTHDVQLQHGRDQWSWNDGQQRPETTSDRLPEITISIGSDRSTVRPGQGTIMTVLPTRSVTNTTISEFTTGISVDDLSGADKELLTFPAVASRINISTTALSEIEAALRSIKGLPRIFPIITTSEDAPDVEPHPTLTRVVGARVMDVQKLDTEIRVTLQPCVLSTATAVIAPVGSTTPQNRYIWKITLAE